MKSFFLLVGAALILWSWLMFKRDRDRASQTLSDRTQKDLEAAVEELTSLAEEVTADLKRKSTQLEELIVEADRRIARFEAGTAAQDKAPEMAGFLAPAALPKARLAVATASETGARNEIWELAQKGLDVTEIAKVSKKTKGEVELILGLRKLG